MQYLESFAKPPKYLSQEDDNIGNINPEFLEWDQQDQLLVSWLLSSMPEGILTRMVGCDLASQIWSKLNLYFAAQTRAKISRLKILLQNVKKNSLSINDFLSKVKNIVDRLASVGHTVSSSDHIESIFNGLPIEYDTFIITVNSITEDYTVEEIESLLLA